MKFYKCHKVVQAAKITDIRSHPDSEVPYLTLVLEGGDIKVALPDWIERHNPKVGGYLVIYASGYESYSPTQEFEEGYTEL